MVCWSVGARWIRNNWPLLTPNRPILGLSQSISPRRQTTGRPPAPDEHSVWHTPPTARIHPEPGHFLEVFSARESGKLLKLPQKTQNKYSRLQVQVKSQNKSHGTLHGALAHPTLSEYFYPFFPHSSHVNLVNRPLAKEQAHCILRVFQYRRMFYSTTRGSKYP